MDFQETAGVYGNLGTSSPHATGTVSYAPKTEAPQAIKAGHFLLKNGETIVGNAVLPIVNKLRVINSSKNRVEDLTNLPFACNGGAIPKESHARLQALGLLDKSGKPVDRDVKNITLSSIKITDDKKIELGTPLADADKFLPRYLRQEFVLSCLNNANGRN
jgi:hypothetical protein